MIDATKDIDLKVVEVNSELERKKDKSKKEDQNDNELGITSMNVKVKGFEGEKKITMNTSVLENKINAIQVIKTLAQYLHKSFFEHVEPSLNLIVT